MVTTIANTVPWWAEWVKAVPALLGVLLGAGLTFATGAIQRRWKRGDKTRELMMARGEELLDQCQQLVEWKENARKVAFTREWQGFVPSEGPMYRISAIVELFFPDLSNQAQTLSNATFNYRHYLHGVAMILQANSEVAVPQRKTLHQEQLRLEEALAVFLHTARKQVREHVESARSR